MMVIEANDILLDNQPSVREKSEQVTLPLSEEDRTTLTAMIEYVRASHNDEYCQEHNIRPSVGIAAPQIGVNKRMIAISIELDDEGNCIEFALVNPKIISNSTMKSYLENGESCLSVAPDVEGIVPRYHKITVRAYNMLTESYEEIRLRDYPAIVMQHEIDHLSGILYYDHIDKNEPWKPIENAVII